jgi:hypothetical protein
VSYLIEFDVESQYAEMIMDVTDLSNNTMQFAVNDASFQIGQIRHDCLC